MDDNEREALRLVKEAATVHDEADLPPWLMSFGIVAFLVVAGVFVLLQIDPCLFVRMKWWMGAEAGVRHCAWQAECTKDDEGYQLAFQMVGREECTRFSGDMPIPHF